jgi:hypothetical protein
MPCPTSASPSPMPSPHPHGSLTITTAVNTTHLTFLTRFPILSGSIYSCALSLSSENTRFGRECIFVIPVPVPFNCANAPTSNDITALSLAASQSCCQQIRPSLLYASSNCFLILRKPSITSFHSSNNHRKHSTNKPQGKRNNHSFSTFNHRQNA